MNSVVSLVVILVILLGLGWGTGGGALVVGGLSGMLWCALLALAIQIVVFVPSRLAKTERFFDLTGGLTYVTVAALALWIASVHEMVSLRRVVLGAMVAFWAGRLSIFLFLRIHRAGKDGRFDDIKTHTLRFLIAWMLQALWVFFTAMPVYIQLTAAEPDPVVGLWEVMGWSIWCIGIGLEIVADQQKTSFNNNPKNHGRWIDSGLWAYSQHPNYFGEIVLWAGLCISGFGIYSGAQWLAVLSPIFVFVLLTRISGIPLLRGRAEAKWGSDPAFQAYRRNTSVLIPWMRGKD